MSRSSLLMSVCFLVLAVLYLAQSGELSSLHYKSWFLLAGLLLSVVASIFLRFGPEETFAAGILFAVPLVDRLFSFPSLEGRMVEDLMLYFVVPLVLFLLITRKRAAFRSIGLGLGGRRRTIRTTAGLLLLASLMAFAGLFFPSMTRYYPIWRMGGSVTMADFAYNEFLIAVIMFSGEFFYRGIVLFTLGRRSFWGAIVLQSIPYAFLHIGKPLIEVPYSLVAGLIFGWANLRSRSILPSWLTHFVGSALFDALILLT